MAAAAGCKLLIKWDLEHAAVATDTFGVLSLVIMLA